MAVAVDLALAANYAMAAIATRRVSRTAAASNAAITVAEEAVVRAVAKMCVPAASVCASRLAAVLNAAAMVAEAVAALAAVKMHVKADSVSVSRIVPAKPAAMTDVAVAAAVAVPTRNA